MKVFVPLHLFLFALLGLAACERASSAHPSEGEVRLFLQRYFSTWSAQDMQGYGDCFHEQARVSFLPGNGNAPRTEVLSDFLHGQRLAHQTSPEKMTETADSMEILMDDRAAQARVRWTLIKGSVKTSGTDFFSLIRTPSGWKIIHLTFYAD